MRIDLTNAAEDVSLISSTGGTIGANITAVSIFAVSLSADHGGDGAGYQNDGGPDNGGQSFVDVSNSQFKTVNASFMNTYAGPGTFDIAVSGIQSFNTAAVSGASGSFTNSVATGIVTITYNYTAAVPEPASSSLLGGLGFLCLLRRRRH